MPWSIGEQIRSISSIGDVNANSCLLSSRATFLELMSQIFFILSVVGTRPRTAWVCSTVMSGYQVRLSSSPNDPVRSMLTH